ncbi:energy-coupling factor transporter transmembrane component T family protein [Bifidobacterium crudilactis]|jgi:biotin transport system permease protein|uniref:energy-coupling factor transporter transmembrane component T family protein n=1 Tax=Bifidobacterium crudilactis TaxID=327277 RepID=UPI002355E968|nr:energy-coupling factor transporter transmembrane protein EcfT [Bifidobacterium crudilactis]MCI1637070.1 energy-coupling factor transporter transmembrane protein EcfT [Bifidobacterium crudilactis]MCI1644304.1 energy-coupling factor transporter transmembrane protein EcfT [Bifidobacterium crudilactis]MCI1889201.1 energy-coupling factor transporter transmembrane protein EcfT [Bifidobacterium crudilactis]MCI2149341.1 energy-coupling factor transporter transmembrane protein EcfT [Bifidobacterium c
MIASLYRPGDSPLHRCPALWKLLVLFVAGVSLAIPFARWWVLGAVSVLCVIAFIIGGFGITELFRQAWNARWILAFTIIAQVFFQSWQRMSANTLRVLDVVLLASLVTLSTPVSELLDGMLSLLRPLSRLGVNTDAIALVTALTLSAIPLVSANMRAVREAHIARGGHGGVMAWAVPLLVISLKQADELADAMDARGI